MVGLGYGLFFFHQLLNQSDNLIDFDSFFIISIQHASNKGFMLFAFKGLQILFFWEERKLIGMFIGEFVRFRKLFSEGEIISVE